MIRVSAALHGVEAFSLHILRADFVFFCFFIYHHSPSLLTLVTFLFFPWFSLFHCHLQYPYSYLLTVDCYIGLSL